MPCRDDYPDPTERNKRHQMAAKQLLRVLRLTDTAVPVGVIEKLQIHANDTYANCNNVVAKLCTTMKKIEADDPSLFKKLTKGKSGAALLYWWEDHKDRDAKRLKREAEEKARKAQAKAVMDKVKKALTKAEFSWLKEQLK